ncbi:MAG: hypothetical protein KGO47_09885, partial [Cyanobacteria bacterium REEB417]|nr:hypothetical protein [Cyanobacteria bacterium REEB417]
RASFACRIVGRSSALPRQAPGQGRILSRSAGSQHNCQGEQKSQASWDHLAPGAEHVTLTVSMTPGRHLQMLRRRFLSPAAQLPLQGDHCRCGGILLRDLPRGSPMALLQSGLQISLGKPTYPRLQRSASM